MVVKCPHTFCVGKLVPESFSVGDGWEDVNNGTNPGSQSVHHHIRAELLHQSGTRRASCPRETRDQDAQMGARKRGLAAELYVANVLHPRTYPWPRFHTWHWSKVPDEHLIGARLYPGSYEELRLKRVAAAAIRSKQGSFSTIGDDPTTGNPLQDIGLDFLMYDTELKTYHPGQVKDYSSGKLCNDDVSGFMMNFIALQTTGFLYSTVEMSNRLKWMADMNGKFTFVLIEPVGLPKGETNYTLVI